MWDSSCSPARPRTRNDYQIKRRTGREGRLRRRQQGGPYHCRWAEGKMLQAAAQPQYPLFAQAWAQPDVTHTEAEARGCAQPQRVRAGYALVRPSRVRDSCGLTVASRGWRRRGCRSASPGQEAGLWSARCPGRVPAGRAGGGGRSACRARLCAASSGLERAVTGRLGQSCDA